MVLRNILSVQVPCAEYPEFSLIDFLSEDPLPQVDPRDKSEHPVQV